jgi:hypothetical protein
MEYDRDKLITACKSIVKIISASNESVRISEDEILGNLLDAVEEHILRCSNLGHDPNIVVRAMHYLVHTHAFPGGEVNVNTYKTMLDVLMEIALPMAVQRFPSCEFLDDMLSGISYSKENLEK